MNYYPYSITQRWSFTQKQVMILSLIYHAGEAVFKDSEYVSFQEFCRQTMLEDKSGDYFYSRNFCDLEEILPFEDAELIQRDEDWPVTYRITEEGIEFLKKHNLI